MQGFSASNSEEEQDHERELPGIVGWRPMEGNPRRLTRSGIPFYLIWSETGVPGKRNGICGFSRRAARVSGF